MDKKKKLLLNWWLNSGGGSTTPWYLAGGIAESTDYTIYDAAGASSEANSYINIANPGTRDALPQNSPTFTLGVGWTGNASNMYFDTQTVYGANTTVIIMYRDPTANAAAYLIGALQTSPNRTATIAPYSSTNVGWQVAQSFVSSASRHLGGTIGFTMSSPFRNGVKDSTLSFTWAGSTTTRTIKLLAYDNGSISGYNAATIHRVAIYPNLKLTDAQILAVSNEMLKVGESTLDATYSNKVLALTPSYYAPLNVKSGFMFVKDYSGNNIPATYMNRNDWTGGVAGQYGNAVHCSASGSSQILPNVNAGYNNLRDFDLDECTISMWVKINYSAPLNQKLIEIWRTGLNDYVAYEIRGTDKFGFFTKTSGVSQDNPNLFTGGSGWHLLIMYNSVSQGVVGMRYDSANYPIAKTLGATITRTNQLCEIGVIDGDVQHVAIFPRLLSQAEMDTLL